MTPGVRARFHPRPPRPSTPRAAHGRRSGRRHRTEVTSRCVRLLQRHVRDHHRCPGRPTSFQVHARMASQLANSRRRLGDLLLTARAVWRRCRWCDNDPQLMGEAGLQHATANLTTWARSTRCPGLCGDGVGKLVRRRGRRLRRLRVLRAPCLPASRTCPRRASSCVELSCSRSCFVFVQETNQRRRVRDWLGLNCQTGASRRAITNGTNYSTAESRPRSRRSSRRAGPPPWPGSAVRPFDNTGFQITYGGTLGLLEQPGAARRPGLHVRRVGVRG